MNYELTWFNNLKIHWLPVSIPLLFSSFNNVSWALIMGQVLWRPNHVQKRLHLWLPKFTAQEGSNPKAQHWWNDKHEKKREIDIYL